jgi:hypothetical protein
VGTVIQNHDERHTRVLDHRADELFVSLQKLKQSPSALLVPRLLGWPDVCGECAPPSSHDVVQAPGPDLPLGSGRQGQPGTHTLDDPVALLRIRRAKCPDQSAEPFLLAADIFRQTRQGRSQVFGIGNLPRNPSDGREFEAVAMAGVGFQKPTNPYLFVQFCGAPSGGVTSSPAL